MTRSLRITLNTDADPGMLPRIVTPLARRDLVPEELQCRRHGDGLRVELAICGPGDDLRLVVGNLRQIVGVRACVVEPAALMAA